MNSRVYKFRAWIIEEKRMEYDGFAIGVDGSFWQYADQGYYVNNLNASEEHKASLRKDNIEIKDDFVLMQFTGLHDKNGKEIYEADIIQWGGEAEPVVVAWSSMYASFGLHRNGWIYMHYFGEAVDSTDCEVIGNVHQNPELLQ